MASAHCLWSQLAYLPTCSCASSENGAFTAEVVLVGMLAHNDKIRIFPRDAYPPTPFLIPYVALWNLFDLLFLEDSHQ
jgi:hypothetical protein